MTNLVILTIIFISYITFLQIKFKKPISSLSKSWYLLGTYTKHLFVGFCFGVGINIIYLDTESLLTIFAGICLMNVGVATEFEDDNLIVKWIHYISAGLTITLLIFYLMLDAGFVYYGISIITSLVGASFLIKKNRIYWVEVIAFTLIVIGFYYKFLV